MEAALAAFASDFSYALAMIQKAQVIQRKRNLWAARRLLREAEAAAHDACKEAAIRFCTVSSACGTGECPFAPLMLRQLPNPEIGEQKRPAKSESPDYDLDSLTAVLTESRFS